MSKKLFLYLFFFIQQFLVFNGFAQSFENQFYHILDSTFNKNKDAIGILVDIESTRFNISWNEAIGYNNQNSNELLNKHQPALIASNTKTYIAVAILKLVENNQLKLEDSIIDFLTPSTKTTLTAAGYKLNEISVKNLLSHTSGINDYVDNSYFNYVEEKPQHKWTRDEQIALAAQKGKPLAAPGHQFSYGDINYLLLTEIIENKTKQPFYTAIRELINFRDLGIHSTWFTQLENQPLEVQPLAHQYWGERNWDSYNIHPSWDLYGGGGLVATVKDLAIFFQKLFEGQIIKNKELLSELHSYVLPKEESNYCLGIRNISFYGLTGYYHGGFWGTDVMYLPEYDLTIAVYTLQKDKRDLNAVLSYKFFEVIEKQLKN